LSACADVFRATDLASSILWSATYVLILRRGFLDKTSGVPLLALASAITWELIFAVVRPTPGLPPFVVPVWFVLDAGIVYQYLLYGSAPRPRAGWNACATFYATFTAALAGAFGLEYAIVLDWGDRDGVYSGFAVNVVMSLAFLAMLARRRDVRGQSMYIALGKLTGTAITIPHAYALHGALASLRVFMGVSFLGDVAYAVLLDRRCRPQGFRPWARL
jgi:hypothetical protein